MKIIDACVMRIERVGSIITTQVKHHAPEIEFGIGVGLIIIGSYKMFKAGQRSEREGYKKKLDQDVSNMNSALIPNSVRDRGKTDSYISYALSEAKNTLPAVACVGGGLFFMKRGFDRVKRSNRVLEAALAGAVAANKAAEKAIAEKYGVNARDEILVNGKNENVEVRKEYDDGTFRTYKDSYLVTEAFDLPGEAFIYSKETCIGQNFQDSEDYFNALVTDAEAAAKRMLENTHGYVFDSDIVKYFCVEPKPIHRVCGSVMPDAKHPRPGDEDRSGTFTFYTKRIKVVHEDGSASNGWLVVPNSDGSIIDIYHLYSLQRLYARERIGQWTQR